MKRTLLVISLFMLCVCTQAHPLHLSVTNIVLENGKLKVILKTFPDDWETAHFHYTGSVIDLGDAEKRSGPWFRSYLDRSFRISYEQGGEPIPLLTESILHEGESMTIEMSGGLKENVKTLYIYHSLLTDIYPDQSNLVILVNGKQEIGIEFDIRKREEKVLLK